MKALKPLIEKLKSEEFPFPSRLNVIWKNNKDEEGFSLNYSAGNFRVEADSPLGAVYGISLAKAAAASGHIKEYVGRHQPELPLRPLWIRDFSPVTLSDNQIGNCCETLLKLGYNAVLVDVPGQDDLDVADALCEKLTHIRKFGVKLLFRAAKEKEQTVFPWERHHSDSLLRIFRILNRIVLQGDCVIWESEIYNPKFTCNLKARELLDFEFAKLEIASLRKTLDAKCRLIYSLCPANSSDAKKLSKWALRLCYEVPGNTIIAFSAPLGNPENDYREPHPLWNRIRLQKVSSSLNLMPVINTGLLGHGEGYWPIISLDLARRYLLRCKFPLFSGVLTLAPFIPGERSFLSCSLWTASQVLWGNKHPQQLAETWLEAYRLDKSFSQYFHIYDETREVSLGLGRMNAAMSNAAEKMAREEGRNLAESILSRLNTLAYSLDKGSEKGGSLPQEATLRDYFILFARDAKRIIYRFVQHYQISIVNGGLEQDSGESFWTEACLMGESNLITSAKVNIFERARLTAGSSLTMRKIFEEVRGEPPTP